MIRNMCEADTWATKKPSKLTELRGEGGCHDTGVECSNLLSVTVVTIKWVLREKEHEN